MKKNIEVDVPEDLGVKFGTPIEAAWTATKKEVEDSIIKMNMNLAINEAILKIADEKIAEEQKKADK